jgi:hypothetical protein
MRPFRTQLLTAAALLPLAAQAQTVSPSAQAILAAAKQASGGAAWDRLTTTHDSGTLTAGGLRGTYQDWMDWPHLKQAQTYTLGPATGAQGWDGKQTWSVDPSGQVRVETSAEAIAAALQSAYFATYAMFFAGRYPALIEDAGSRSADGVTYQALKITPKGGDPVEVWFDPATHLMARGIELTGAQPHTTIASAYRMLDGVMVPTHEIVRVANNPKYDMVIDETSMESVPVPDSRFAPPPPPAYDASFPAGKTAVTVPFRLLNNHIYLMAAIDGQPPVPFMFDTGATNFMDSAHAKLLGVKTEGAMAGGGFGSNVSAVGLAKVASVSVGGLALHDQIFATSDLGSFIKVEGADSNGLLGYEFAKRAVMTIDYGKHTITFTKPSAFTPPPGVTPVPFSFDAHVPMVTASIDGVSGEFEIDTGSRGSLTVMHPFALSHGLIDKYHATRLATTGYGVGGPSKALLGRAGALTIGPVTVAQPVLDVVTDTAGAAAQTHTAGNIGGDILKRFTLTLDYGHRLLYFQPNQLAQQPDVFDRAGIWINRADDSMIAIADVTAGSAAAKAGLRAGDEILAVNSRDARTVEIYELREMFKGRPGTALHLKIKGADGKARRVTLRLEEQV